MVWMRIKVRKKGNQVVRKGTREGELISIQNHNEEVFFILQKDK